MHYFPCVSLLVLRQQRRIYRGGSSIIRICFAQAAVTQTYIRMLIAL